jgi:hypothetical protein
MLENVDIRSLKEFVKMVVDRPLDKISDVEAVCGELEKHLPSLHVKLMQTLHLLALSDLLPVAYMTLGIPTSRHVWAHAFITTLRLRSVRWAREHPGAVGTFLGV